jgi:pimeloyl-ACP methyl ester carboxylesterase
MICPKCNTELPVNSVACFHCGYHFKKKNKRKYIYISLPIIIILLALYYFLNHQFKLYAIIQEIPEKVSAGKFPEELVYVRAEDGIPNGGALFNSPKDSAKSIAIIWIHGWGMNFYHPSYVMIGRALADQGYTCITANTRMHDIGFNIGERDGKRIRGGGYWGKASEEVRDIAAWIDFAEKRGFKKVILIGHSAGWAAVRLYQSEKQDPRVIGLVLSSGAVRLDTQVPDSAILLQAIKLVDEGHGDDLIRIPNRRYPSFVSADTYLDFAKNYPPEQRDFFGIQTRNPGITRIHCPLLAFFGTEEPDIGTEADLKLMKSSIHRQSNGPSSVTTTIIQNADHMYSGEEIQVAHVITQWADKLKLKK